MPYDREAAKAYAKKWAFSRNPAYYDFHGIGGDCTNFVSQCLYAGCGVMNFTPTFGWYYISLNNRSPSWTGVQYLYNFLISNQGPGPYGEVRPFRDAEIGDIIQLSFDGDVFSHSLFVTNVGVRPSPNSIYVATHTYDAYNRRLSSYFYQEARLIHLLGARA